MNDRKGMIVGGIALAGLGFFLFFSVASIIDEFIGEDEVVFKDEPDGFKDYTWQTNFDDIAGLEIQESRARKFDLPNYSAVKNNESLIFDGTPVSKIVYGFDDHKLRSVTVEISEEENFKAIREKLFNRHGKRDKNKKGEYFWKGENTELTLSYSNPEDINHYGSMFIESTMNRLVYSHLTELPYDIHDMKFYLLYNKKISCFFASSELEYLEESKYYNVYLCKFFEQANKLSKPTIDKIIATGQIDPEAQLFSVFIESEEENNYVFTLYEELKIGLFSSVEDCQRLYSYALDHNIPARKCRSWESYEESKNALYKTVQEVNLE